MTALVKWYDTRTDSGLGTYSANVANTLNPILQKILVDGYNVQTVSSIVTEGTLITVTTSANHGYRNNQVIKLSGATPSTYNGEWRITVIALNKFTFTITPGPAGISVLPTDCRVASLGWSLPFTPSGNIMVARQGSGSMDYFRFDDPASMTATRSNTGGVVSYTSQLTAELKAYSTMSDINTGTLQGNIYLHRALAGTSTTGIHLTAVGDDAGVWVFLQHPGAYTTSMYYIGDLLSQYSGDKPSVLWGRYGFSASTNNPYAGNFSLYAVPLGYRTGASPGGVMLRNHLGYGSGVTGFLTTAVQSLAGEVFGSSAGASPALPLGSNQVMFPAYCQYLHTPFSIRGQFPGLYSAGITLPMPTNDHSRLFGDMTINGSPRNILGVAVYDGTTVGMACIDITGPWR